PPGPPLAIAQQAYLKPAAVGTTQAEDYFGGSVAVSGDTVVIGAPREDSSTTGVNSTANESATHSGAAYIFVRSGTNWTQQAYLKPAATQRYEGFGISVAASGDTAVVGADPGNSGAAYVFVRSGTNWTQQAFLKSAATQTYDFFGNSVAV